MKTTITTLAAAAAACLAMAGPAPASDLYGSDLNPTHQASTLSCPAYPCTMAQEHFADWESSQIPQTGVITKWKVKLSPGAKATLKVLDLDDYGQGYRTSDTGPTVTGTGGVTTVNTRLFLIFSSYYTGIQLDNGSVLTDRVDDYYGPQTMVFNRALPQSPWFQPDSHPGHELLSQVEIEPDQDGDGYGDETQDPCVGCNNDQGQPNQPTDPGNGPAPRPDDPDRIPALPPQNRDPYDAELAKRPPLKLTVKPKAWFDTTGKTAVLHTYYANEGRYPINGTVQLLDGKKALPMSYGNADLATDSSGGTTFKPSRALAKKLRRGKRVKLTLVARMTTKNGTKATVRSNVTAIGRGATKAYDGVYASTSGLKFTVSDGFLTDARSDVRTFCPGSNTFRSATFAEPESFPAMVGRNGAFRADGNYDKDHVKIEGKLGRRGTGKGKLSLFHTELTFGDSLGIDQCAGTSDWTVKRAPGGR